MVDAMVVVLVLVLVMLVLLVVGGGSCGVPFVFSCATLVKCM